MAVAVLVTMVALAVSNVLIQRETAQKEEALNDKTKALEAAQVSEQNAKIQESLAKASAEKAEAERRTAKANETTAKAQGLLARRRFYAAQMNLAMQAWEKGDLARARPAGEPAALARRGRPAGFRVVLPLAALSQRPPLRPASCTPVTRIPSPSRRTATRSLPVGTTARSSSGTWARAGQGGP